MQIFFDFDGTLADSSPGIYASFEHACLDQGLVAPPYEDFCASIGPPVEVLARQFFPRLVAAELESFRQTFRHVYDQGQFRLCNWYDGVEQTLGAISEFPGVRLAIITNKPTIPTFKLLASAELTSYFELIAGIDYRVVQGIGSTFMQKSEAIQFAQTVLPSHSSTGFYIGDTPSDRHASLACGLEFIAATYGFHSWQESELNSTLHVPGIKALIPCLRLFQ